MTTPHDDALVTATAMARAAHAHDAAAVTFLWNTTPDSDKPALVWALATVPGLLLEWGCRQRQFIPNVDELLVELLTRRSRATSVDPRSGELNP